MSCGTHDFSQTSISEKILNILRAACRVSTLLLLRPSRASTAFHTAGLGHLLLRTALKATGSQAISHYDAGMAAIVKAAAQELENFKKAYTSNDLRSAETQLGQLKVC